MSELRVRITGDAASFQQTLNTAKTDAAKFNQQLVQQTKVAQQAAAKQRQAISGGKQALGGAGMLASNAAMIAGEGPVGQAIGKTNAIAQNAIILGIGMKQAADGLKGLSASGGIVAGLKVAGSMAKKALVGVAGALGVFALIIGAGIGALWMVKKKIQMLEKELEDNIRTNQVETKAKNAYIEVLKKNRGQLKEGEYERLRRGVLTGDRGAISEIQNRFGGTKFNEELKKDLIKAQIAAMPEGARKDIAEERLRYSEAREAAKERIGGRSSQATQALARQLFASIDREHQNRLAEINKKQLDELKKINQNTKSTMDNPFR